MTDPERVTFEFEGPALTTEEIAWIVREAALIGQARYTYGHIYRTEGDHVVLGCGSRFSWDNIQVVPIDSRQVFMQGACFSGIALIRREDNWGHHPADSRSSPGAYPAGQYAFREDIEIAFRRARDKRFPSLKLDEAS